jgi:hypothetical protein
MLGRSFKTKHSGGSSYIFSASRLDCIVCKGAVYFLFFAVVKMSLHTIAVSIDYPSQLQVT